MSALPLTDKYDSLSVLILALESAQRAAKEAGEQNTYDILGDLIHTHKADQKALEEILNQRDAQEARAMNQEYYKDLI